VAWDTQERYSSFLLVGREKLSLEQNGGASVETKRREPELVYAAL
jgi:hypothetical protein